MRLTCAEKGSLPLIISVINFWSTRWTRETHNQTTKNTHSWTRTPPKALNWLSGRTETRKSSAYHNQHWSGMSFDHILFLSHKSRAYMKILSTLTGTWRWARLLIVDSEEPIEGSPNKKGSPMLKLLSNFKFHIFTVSPTEENLRSRRRQWQLNPSKFREAHDFHFFSLFYLGREDCHDFPQQENRDFKNRAEKKVRKFGLLVEEAPIVEAEDKSGSPNLPHHGSNLPALLVPLRHYNLYICLKRKIPRTKINPP